MPTTFANTIDGCPIYAKRAEEDQSGVNIEQNYAKKTEIPDGVPSVTSSDDGKVLKASYSGGQGSFSWQTESGGSSNLVILDHDSIASTYATVSAMVDDINTGKQVIIRRVSSGFTQYFILASIESGVPYFIRIEDSTTSGLRTIGYGWGYVRSDMSFSWSNYNSVGMYPRDWVSSGGSTLSRYVPTGSHTNGEYIFVRTSSYTPRIYKCILDYTESSSTTDPSSDSTHWSRTYLTDVINELRNSGGTQVQADWNETDPTDPSYIQNKPTINNVPAVTSSDDGKVLKASYTGGQGSYAWATESGGGSLPSSTSADEGKVLTVDSSGDPAWEEPKGLFIATYGVTTYNEIYDAVQANKIVYCKSADAVVNYRLAFLAYVSSSNFEFQYYRSPNSHSATNQTDEVYIYKVTSSNAWTTTTRKTGCTMVAGTGMTRSYSADTITLGLYGVSAANAGKTLAVNSAGTDVEWVNKETVLFDSNNTNATSATLSESYKNFEYCKFFFRNGDGDVICREVYSAAQSNVITVVSGTISTEPKLYSKVSTYAITGNTQIDHRNSIAYNINSNAITSYTSSVTANYIIRVVGINRISS